MGLRATATIDPVKVYRYDRDLHCDVVRVVGYKAVCTCGWVGSQKVSVSAARVTVREHRDDCTATREVERARSA